MRWFRLHGLKVAPLALFALACQFVLAFGHVHLDRFSDISTISAKVVSADLPTSPRPSPGSAGEDFCAIWANMSLAGALVIPVPPAQAPRISSDNELHWSFAATAALSLTRFHFEARGPPRA
jgi:hypothetical protein